MTKTALVLLAGIAGGFLNTMAGGGSLITIPTLIFMGLPSAVANGTNRVALMVQNIVAVTNFRSKGYFDPKLGIMLGVPALVGSVLGSNIAVGIPDVLFKKILAVVMLVTVTLIVWQPQNRFAPPSGELTRNRLILAMVSFFLVGLYGGFIQIGVGFIIIITLYFVTGMSLVRINSLKVLIVLVYMPISLLVFALSGKVDWLLGFVMAAGNGIGAWLGSNLTVKGGEKWVKIVLALSVAFMSARLLGIF